MKHMIALTAVMATLIALPTQTLAQPRGCPPGLAKKDPPCVPPGQARNGVTTSDWLNRHRIGDRLDRGEFIYLEDTLAFPRLPDGQRYAVIDDMIVVIDETDYQLVQLIRALTDVLR